MAFLGPVWSARGKAPGQEDKQSSPEQSEAGAQRRVRVTQIQSSAAMPPTTPVPLVEVFLLVNEAPTFTTRDLTHTTKSWMQGSLRKQRSTLQNMHHQLCHCHSISLCPHILSVRSNESTKSPGYFSNGLGGAGAGSIPK